MTLLELMYLLRRHLALVIVFPIATALITAIVCFGFLPNQYTATVSMYILSGSSSSTSTTTSTSSTDYSDLTASQLLANDFATIAKSDLVKSKAASALGMSSLSNYTISVDSSTTTRVITLAVTGTNPASTMTIANAVASVLSDTAVSVMDVQSVNIIDAATQPTSPSGPPRVMYILVAALAGLFLAIALIVIRDMADTTIKGSEDVQETLGLPVLGQMPKVRG